MTAARSGKGNDGILMRAGRIVVPWVALIVVLAFLWSFLTDYRAATVTPETTTTVEATVVAGIPEGEPYVRVLSDGLNLRAEPSTSAPIVKVLDGDVRLLFIEEGTGWYQVEDPDGTQGWVAAGGRYTELVQP